MCEEIETLGRNNVKLDGLRHPRKSNMELIVKKEHYKNYDTKPELDNMRYKLKGKHGIVINHKAN